MPEGTPVIVTTEYRGVFYGRLSDDQDKTSRTLTLTQCRNAIYWSGTEGFLGLASTGPAKESRIGATAPAVLLHGICSISECTPEAAKRWEEWA